MLAFIKHLLNRPPEKERFAGMALAALRRTWPAEAFTLDLAKFQIQQAGGFQINLHNIYLDYCRAEPPLRREQLDRFARGLVSPQADALDFETAAPQLLPVLRNLCGIDLVRIENDDGKALSAVMAYRPLSDQLGIAVAIDSELAITQIGSDVLQRWGKSLDELLQVAIDNLRHKAAPAFQEISPGLFVSQYGDFYDAPRMLVAELVWQLPVGGSPVVMVPNRSCMFVCASENGAALDSMVDRARSMLLEESRPLSDEMFKLEETGWTAWCPPGQHGLKLRRLQREFLASGYAEQKRALDTVHEKSGKDVFVATQALIQHHEDGELISYAVLTHGVHTMLPKADVICLLAHEGAETLVVSMADFLECADRYAVPLAHVLPRYEVVRFPGPDAMERLRGRATSIAAVPA